MTIAQALSGMSGMSGQLPAPLPSLRSGKGYLFDGIDDVAVAAVRVTGAGAVTQLFGSALIRADVLNSVNGIMHENNATGNNRAWVVRLNGVGVVQVILFPDGLSPTFYEAAAAPLSIGVIYHVAFYYGQGRVFIFVNGSLVYSAVSVLASIHNHAGSFAVGVNSGTANSHFKGIIADVMVATGDEAYFAMQNIKDVAGGGYTGSPEARYLCDEGSGIVATDSSGNGNSLTLTNITESTFHTTDAGIV